MKYSELFRVKPGSQVRLSKIDPEFTAKHKNKKSALRETEKATAKLRNLQYLLYAEGKRSLLVVLQALDAAGKDGTINHVLGAMNPQGTRVHGFKVPSAEERAHDFLWRIEQQAPKIGEVVIFNRSHYEDVLVTRVHGLVPKPVWSKRYALINDFEKGLVANGTHVLKFFLHISPEEQLLRFKQRLDDAARHWKISDADYAERKLWPDYTKAYEEALSKTSTKHAPWFVIPSNNKWFRNLAVSKIVAETMESLGMKFPKPTVDIERVRRQYHEAERSEEKILGKKKWTALEAREAAKECKDAGAKGKPAPERKHGKKAGKDS
jgi:PPK2 family polyphosphate:nucleotide phosphotransferase